MADKLYPDLDPSTLEPYYCRHVEAMTVEGLHEKSDIAIQLAWRDARIADLEGHVRWFVEKAADEKLDGYRELGQRAADAENALDTAKRRIADLESQLAEANHWRERHSRDAEAYGKQSNESWKRLQAANALLEECEELLASIMGAEMVSFADDEAGEALLAKLRGRDGVDG